MTDTKLWWASVGGNSCEPVRVAGEGENAVFYSVGCTDPHPMDGVILVKEITGYQIPLSPKEVETNRLRRQKEFEKARKAGNLSYRQWGPSHSQP